MSRETIIASAIAELDQAIEGVTTARKMIADLEQRSRSGEPSPQRTTRPLRDLRYSGMTVSEAAAALGIGDEHLRRLLRRGDLDGVPYRGRIGWRLDRSYVLELAGQLSTAKAGQDAARASVSPVKRPVGRPPKQRVGRRKHAPSSRER